MDRRAGTAIASATHTNRPTCGSMQVSARARAKRSRAPAARRVGRGRAIRTGRFGRVRATEGRRTAPMRRSCRQRRPVVARNQDGAAGSAAQSARTYVAAATPNGRRASAASGAISYRAVPGQTSWRPRNSGMGGVFAAANRLDAIWMACASGSAGTVTDAKTSSCRRPHQFVRLRIDQRDRRRRDQQHDHQRACARHEPRRPA